MKKIKDLNIKLKMAGLMGIFIVGFVAASLSSYFTIKKIGIDGPLDREMTQMEDLAVDVAPPRLYLLPIAYDSLRLNSLLELHRDKVPNRIERIQKGIKDYREAREYFTKTLDGSEPDKKEILEMLNEADAPAQDFLAIVEQELIPAAQKGDREKVKQLTDGVLYDKLALHWDVIEHVQTKAGESDKATTATAKEAADSSVMFSMILSVVVLGIVVAFAWFISSNLVTRMQTVAERAETLRSICITNLGKATEALAVGDLDVVIETGTKPIKDESKDELGNLGRSVDGIIEQTVATIASFESSRVTLRNLIRETTTTLRALANKDLGHKMEGEYVGEFTEIKTSLNSTLETLSDTLRQISVGADQVASAAKEINSGSQDLAQGSSEQASSLEEVSSNLQEISSMTKQNASNAKEGRAMSDSARTAAQEGLTHMSNLSDAVTRIKASSDSTAKIVKTIEEIALQTNLLALNAAVEAARAGDAGKGFAVVAEEVRNLAMRSAEAAKTTAQLIDEAVRNTEEGVALNAEVSQNLDEINNKIEKVSVIVAEIAAASEQQTQGVEQINVAVEQMNGVTQQTAANSEESASAAEELSSQSQEMLSLISMFNFGKDVENVRRMPASNGASRSMNAQTFTSSKAVMKNGNGAYSKNGGFINPSKLIPFNDTDDAVLGEF